MNVILLGAPGAGKGTQGALLAEQRNLLHLAMGDVLREAVREGTALGEEARKYMDAGELVPDDIILGLVREKLAAAVDPDGSANGYVLDGFPRSVEQAEALDGILAELDGDRAGLDAVVVIEVPTDVLVKRVTGRRTCTDCDAVYNIHYDPPAKADACAACGGELVRRTDDDPETVRRRLEVYEKRTRPLIAYYRESPTPLHCVDGDRPVDQVRRGIMGALERDTAPAHGAQA